jgi:hypothetical protein
MEPIRQESQDHLYDGDCDSAYYEHILDQAALLLARGEPDRAALILDGVAQRMVISWFAESGARVPEPSYLLPRLEEEMSPLAWWLRLALRAPDVDARLVHCRRLLDEIAVGRAL